MTDLPPRYPECRHASSRGCLHPDSETTRPYDVDRRYDSLSFARSTSGACGPSGALFEPLSFGQRYGCFLTLVALAAFYSTITYFVR